MKIISDVVEIGLSLFKTVAVFSSLNKQCQWMHQLSPATVAEDEVLDFLLKSGSGAGRRLCETEIFKGGRKSRKS